jgi:hypothetical protein
MYIKETYLGAIALIFLFSGQASGSTETAARKSRKTVVTTVKETVVKEAEPLTIVEAEKENDPFIAVAPEIPEEIEFCGDKIDLRRYDLRERFDREMMMMMYMHSTSLILLKRANRYFPIIESILKANDLPDDLKYLACIESTLNPRAVSAAKAIGMWQFMPETAKQFGLEVSDYVDERYDVEKETQAACMYLKDAYSKYGDWSTACASYNTGTNRVTTELERQGVKTGLDLWLVEETQRYVFRILACKEFFNHPKKYGFFIRGEQLYQPVVFRDTLVTGNVPNWVEFAKNQGINYYDLKSYNSWIRNDSLPNLEMKPYKVSIPLKESQYFDKKKIVVHQKNWVTDPN